ncbi:MAG TPA: hypothetical protein DEZ08_04505 [Dehalococcoidia bacterium]|jgi:hypothetical protein|nr:hypothetical protein [Dehalococcoidia bacterium]|tara:strand:- start:2090 stop:2665 length:576 start_codon:yes stop_codon:yes gene_type:complete
MVNTKTTCKVAFKEWAVAVDALIDGEQIMLLRKGGIREDSKHFTVIHDNFLLYPTFEHQSLELLKPLYQSKIQPYEQSNVQTESVIFNTWAEVVEVIETTDHSTLQKLNDYHIWTANYAESRLRWKPNFPLSIMLLKVSKLDKPITVPYKSEYGGCKSWVELEQPLDIASTSVMSEQKLQDTITQIKNALK